MELLGGALHENHGEKGRILTEGHFGRHLLKCHIICKNLEKEIEMYRDIVM